MYTEVILFVLNFCFAPLPEIQVPERILPEITLKPEDVKIQEGESAQFVCKVKGQPTPEITWYLDDQPIENDDIYKVITEEGESTLVLPEAFPEDAGIYTVKAVNEVGTVESTVVLNVTGELSALNIIQMFL